MSPPRHWHTGRPPWWPEGEPWPPADAGVRWRRHRRRFMRRTAFGALIFFALSGIGLGTVVSWIAHGTIGSMGPPRVLGLTAPFILIAVALLAFAALRRVGGPMADLVGAADEIASGHFDVRVPERGPRPMRGVARAF